MIREIEFYHIYVFPESKAVYIPLRLIGEGTAGWRVEYIAFYPDGRYFDGKIREDKHHNIDWFDGFATNYQYNGEQLRDEFTFQQIQKMAIDYIFNMEK